MQCAAWAAAPAAGQSVPRSSLPNSRAHQTLTSELGIPSAETAYHSVHTALTSAPLRFLFFPALVGTQIDLSPLPFPPLLSSPLLSTPFPSSLLSPSHLSPPIPSFQFPEVTAEETTPMNDCGTSPRSQGGPCLPACSEAPGIVLAHHG